MSVGVFELFENFFKFDLPSIPLDQLVRSCFLEDPESQFAPVFGSDDARWNNNERRKLLTRLAQSTYRSIEDVYSQRGELTRMLIESARTLRTRVTNLVFFFTSIETLGAGEENDDAVLVDEMECPICLEQKSRSELSITGPCSHLFCTACITEQITVYKKHDCPTCRRRLELSDLVQIGA